mgnify:CR=1 FL=1
MMQRYLLAFSLLAIGMRSDAQITAIRCGKFFDGKTLSLESGVTILIEGNRILFVGKEPAIPPGSKVIDLSGATVMPGLIDAHTHMFLHGMRYEDAILKKSQQYRAIWATVSARKQLLAGFTTIRDVETEGAGYGDVALRDAINDGIVMGPRMQCATRALSITGGYTPYGFSPDVEIPKGAQLADGIDGVRKAVREQITNGADLIKITATGGVLSFAKNGQNPQFSLDEAKAIVDTAHDYGMKVAAHAHGDEGMQRAILAGVDSIEHGTYMSDETMRLMKEKGTWYVPTISAGVFVGEMAAKPGYYPEIVRPKALAVGPLIQATFGRAYKAGVKIAFGTDAGVFPHGRNAREFELMVGAGMPPLEAIQSATRNAAELLGESANLGGLSSGKYADLVAVEGDPLEDITRMQSMAFVMKGGVVYKSP